MQSASRALTPIFTASVAAFLVACQSTPTAQPDIPGVQAARAEQLDRTFSRLVADHDITTAGAAIIKNGKVVWTGHYGEQSPGVPASASTQFNVASITKVVTAETILRLVDDGKLSLDEPIAPYWTDPEIVDDPRHNMLTPRMALTHTTGFPNWRYFLPDKQLVFVHDPGSRYGYSGEGFEYLARYAEHKLGRDFEELVKEQVFEPLGMTDVSFSAREDNFDNIARPVDEHGVFHGHYCRPGGWCPKPNSFNAAADMVVSVEDYADFLIAVMNADGYSDALAAERDRVQTDKGDQATVECHAGSSEPCPLAQGYGLGWEVLDYGDNKLISHGGSDWSQLTVGYFYTRSRDGLLIFLNAPTHRALAAMPEAIGAIDPGSPMAAHYAMRHQKSMATQQAEP